MPQGDYLDELLFLEDRFYEEGLDSGKLESQKICFSQGKEHGKEKGLEFGQKLGFLEGFAKTILQFSSEGKVPDRAISTLKSIISSIELIPFHNDYNLDYIQILSQLQAKAKLVCVILDIPYSGTPLYAPTKADLTY